jgi:6-phosphofructokinase 1
MVTIQGNKLIPVPFKEMLDTETGRVRVRYVDVRSEAYQTLDAYMIRLKPEDFQSPTEIRALARAGNLGEAEFARRFGHLVNRR